MGSHLRPNYLQVIIAYNIEIIIRQFSEKRETEISEIIEIIDMNIDWKVPGL